MQQIRKIFGYTSGLGRYMAVIAAMSVLGTLTSLATPYIMKLATDWIVAITTGAASFSWEYLALLIGGIITISIVNIIATDVGGWHGDILAITTRRQLSSVYFKHLLKLPQTYYDNELTGKIINRLSRAITDITQFLQFFSNNLLQMLLTMGITIVILLFYSWPLGLLFVLLIPANLYLTAKTSGKWQRLEGEKNKHFDIASGRFTEVVGQMRLVKSFGSQRRERRFFDGEIAQMIGLTKAQSLHWHGMNALRGAVFGLLFAGIYAVLFYETATGALGLGDMVLLLTLIQQTAFPLRNLSFFVDNYQRAVANSKDFAAAMNEPAERDTASAKLPAVRGEIEYRGVDFAYSDDGKQVLHDISFALKPGKKLALVGESGGGKTTLSNLLMRLYEPTNGAVFIDGTDIATVSKASVRQAIATVFQDAALFSGTIRENILYGRPDASDEQLRAAAKAANALDFIEKLPKGFETEIGERGIKLSGGQKQRLSIARAIVKDAPILILDEATSSLDSKAEHEVQQALDRLMQGRTTLIIAHRLSTIAGVDTIVTLRGGRVDEVGSPAKLAKTDGIYAQLLDLQMGATETAKKHLAKFDIAG